MAYKPLFVLCYLSSIRNNDDIFVILGMATQPQDMVRMIFRRLHLLWYVKYASWEYAHAIYSYCTTPTDAGPTSRWLHAETLVLGLAQPQKLSLGIFCLVVAFHQIGSTQNSGSAKWKKRDDHGLPVDGTRVTQIYQDVIVYSSAGNAAVNRELRIFVDDWRGSRLKLPVGWPIVARECLPQRLTCATILSLHTLGGFRPTLTCVSWE